MSDPVVTDESAREEPGYGDESLSEGPVVDEQLEALGVFGGNPADKAGEKTGIEEVFENAKAEEPSEESEEEEAESKVAEGERVKEVEELETPSDKPDPEEDEEEEPEEDDLEDDESAEEGEEPEESDELETLKEQNAKLIELLNQNVAQEEEQEPAKEPAPTPDPLKGLPKLPEVDAEKLDEIISDPVAFNKHMQNVFSAGQESMYSMMPRVVTQMMETQNVLVDFFSKNADLAPMSDYVKGLAIGIQGRAPGSSASTALEQAGKQVREALRLGKKDSGERGKNQVNKGKNKKSRRRFAPSTSKRSGPTKSSQQKGGKKKADPDSFDAQFEALEKVGNQFSGD